MRTLPYETMRLIYISREFKFNTRQKDFQSSIPNRGDDDMRLYLLWLGGGEWMGCAGWNSEACYYVEIELSKPDQYPSMQSG